MNPQTTLAKKLIQLAEKATPGERDCPNHYHGVVRLQNEHGIFKTLLRLSSQRTTADVRFIAACDPTTIKELMETLVRYEEALQFYANKHSWEVNSNIHRSGMVSSDTDIIDWKHTAGKRARAALSPSELRGDGNV